MLQETYTPEHQSDIYRAGSPRNHSETPVHCRILGPCEEHISFSKVEGIRKLCLDSKPTAKKVIKSLVATSKNEAERESLGFLKKFIKSLDAVSLKVFLKFLTGSDVLIQKNISVSFNSVAGIARAPVAHTCRPCLELPATYQSYN